MQMRLSVLWCVRGEGVTVCFLLSSCKSWDLNPICQVRQQAPLLTEPFAAPHILPGWPLDIISISIYIYIIALQCLLMCASKCSAVSLTGIYLVFVIVMEIRVLEKPDPNPACDHIMSSEKT